MTFLFGLALRNLTRNVRRSLLTSVAASGVGDPASPSLLPAAEVAVDEADLDY